MTGFNTRAIHAGQEPDPTTGAVVPPIYQVSTFKQDGVGGLRNGYEYARSGNPTRDALQECLAALEEGNHAFAFASGLAAEDTLLRTTLRPGDHVILGNDAYGGTYRLFARVFSEWGITISSTDLTNLDQVASSITPKTTMIWIETPTNPMLRIADIQKLADLAHAHELLLVVDNTFASPALQTPLTLGADVVVHSTTKYIGGHSDVVGGALIVNDPELAERLKYHQNAMGAVAGPFDSWLTMRGAKTLGIRMERHCSNAMAVATMLGQHKKVSEVIYPGLTSHAQHDLAAKQMRDFGGMVSFRAAGGEKAALEICEKTKLFTLGESLGGVESLIEHPHRMTHASVAGSALEVPHDLVRLSVGIEDIEDLLRDLDRALGN